MLKLNSSDRLTRAELEFYERESGITELQYKIIKRRFYDKDEPTATGGVFKVLNGLYCTAENALASLPVTTTETGG